jgi:hypothetical protein
MTLLQIKKGLLPLSFPFDVHRWIDNADADPAAPPPSMAIFAARANALRKHSLPRLPENSLPRSSS